MTESNDIKEILSRLEIAVEKIETTAVNERRNERNCYRRELENAVNVLHKTKDAFHSKQLKQLRERIERALQENP